MDMLKSVIKMENPNGEVGMRKTRKDNGKTTNRVARACLALVLTLVFSALMPFGGLLAPATADAAVAVLDNWPAGAVQTGTGNLSGTFAISAGANRLLVIVVTSYDSGGSSGQTAAVTYGGQALTQAVNENTNRRQTHIFYLDETGIAGRSGDAINVTFTGTVNGTSYHVASFTGVDQTTPIAGTSSVYYNNTASPLNLGPATAVVDGYGLYTWAGNQSRTDDTELYTENYDDTTQINGYNFGVASKAMTTTSTNPQITMAGPARVSFSIATVNPQVGTPGTIALSASTYSVGEAGPTVTITATRTGGTLGIVGISYATSNGTAVAGSDYTTASGTLSWGSGDAANKTFNVSITNDTVYEGNETFNVSLSTPTGGATLGSPSSAVVTITDNDAQPTVGFQAASSSGSEGVTPATMPVVLSAAAGTTVTVNYLTSNGTATAADYTPASGTLTFTPGTTSQNVNVTIINDALPEANETFTITLSSPVNATLGTSVHTRTIIDNDTCTANVPTLSISPLVLSAAAGDPADYIISVTNNDTGPCASTTFNINIVSDSNLVNFSPSTRTPASVLLAPGGSNTATLTVTSLVSAPIGAANITTIGVTAAGHTAPPNVAVTTSVSNPIMHNSRNLISTKWSGTWGGWGVAGGKYGRFDCGTCHTRDTSNIKRVRTAITTSDVSKGLLPGHNQPIIYTRTIGTRNVSPGTMGDDSFTPRATSNRICEICHTYDATGANGVNTHPYTYNTGTLPNHMGGDAKDCITCHSHAQGFAKPSCDTCHGNPPVVSTIGGPSGLSNIPHTTGSNTSGGHKAHVNTFGITDCANCHGNYSTTMPQLSTVPALSNKGDISISFNNYGYTTGSYSGQLNVSYNNTAGTGSKVCSNVYCHSNGVRYGTKTYASPVWDNRATAACGTCHGVNHTASPSSAQHAKHVTSSATAQYKYACVKCHDNVTSTADATVVPTITNMVTHVNGTYNVAFDSYNPGGIFAGNCNNLYCHSIGNTSVTTGLPAAYGGSIYTQASWTGTLGCNACHGKSNSKGYPDYTSGGQGLATSNSHSMHADAAASNISCSECHYQTTTTGASIRNDVRPTLHVNKGNQDVAFNLASNPIASYNKTTRTCSTTYCHGVNITWGAPGPLACNACHGANSALQGKHSQHYETTATATNLSAVSNATTTQYRFNCGVCHNSAVISHAGGEIQANIQSAEVAFDATVAGGGTYAAGSVRAGLDAGNRSWTAGAATNACLNTYCHSKGTTVTTLGTYSRPVMTTLASGFSWTGSAVLGCNGCHGDTGSTSGRPTYTNATLKTNAHVRHNTTCEVCHTATTTDGTTIANKANHVNKAYNVTQKASSWQTFSYTFANNGGSCNTIACHRGQTAQWGVTAVNCLTCHNAVLSAPTASLLSGGTVTQRPNVTGEFGLASNHKRSGGAVTSNDCGVCHMEGVANNGWVDWSYHMDGYVDLRDPDTGTTIREATWSNVPAGAGAYSSSTVTARAVRFSRNLASATVETFARSVMINQCLKCHDSNGATSSLAWVPSGVAGKPFNTTVAANPGGNVLDLVSQFATTNRSYHPVLGKQNNAYAGGTRMVAPWNGVVKPGTATPTTTDITVWGPLLTCWDCHAPNGATGVLNRTTTHGGALTGTDVVPMRGQTYNTGTTAATNYCFICHAGYTSADNHAAGSAFSTVNRPSMGGINNLCVNCHSSRNNSGQPARPIGASDAHGYSTRATGAAFPAANNGYAFIRSEGFYASTYQNQTRRVGATNYTSQCTGYGGGTSPICGRGSMGTYQPGGVY